MNINKPVVTIIMPVYNDKANVINAIKSVQEQTYFLWELIIVDDCSKDGTYDVVAGYIKEANDKRIILKRNKKNLGCYICMNLGIIRAKGKYITRIDSDDIYVPDKIKLQVDVLNSRNDCVCVESYYQRADLTVKCNCITMMFRASVIKFIGYYDSLRFAADTEFKHRMYKAYGLKSFYKIKQVLYNAQIRPNSLTRSKDTGGKDLRLEYKKKFQEWHKSDKHVFMPFPLKERPFEVEDIMLP